MLNTNTTQKQNFSNLGTGSKLTGHFKFSGPTRVSSELDGEINMLDKADLFLESTAIFVGNITCHNIEIHGQFEGTLKATGLVSIFPPASLTGDVQCEHLIVYPGSVLNINGHTTDTNPSLQ